MLLEVCKDKYEKFNETLYCLPSVFVLFCFVFSPPGVRVGVGWVNNRWKLELSKIQKILLVLLFPISFHGNWRENFTSLNHSHFQFCFPELQQAQHDSKIYDSLPNKTCSPVSTQKGEYITKPSMCWEWRRILNLKVQQFGDSALVDSKNNRKYGAEFTVGKKLRPHISSWVAFPIVNGCDFDRYGDVSQIPWNIESEVFHQIFVPF